MMTDNKVKTSKIKGLDGLRVYAIAMIVACHTGFFADIAGGVGNKIFFSLSGFLAYYSIKNISGGKDVVRFYIKRFARIVPVFWAVVLIVWRMLPGAFSLRDMESTNSLILNMLFIKNYGHLWFLQHLMLMYLLVPVFWLMYRGISKVVAKISASELAAAVVASVVFVVLAVLEKRFLTSDVLTLTGEGSHSQFQVWMFMFGFAAAIFGDAVKKSIDYSKAENLIKCGKAFTNIYVLAFIAIMTISVIPSVHSTGKLLFFSGEYIRTILSCIAFILFLITEDSLVAKILNCRILVKLSELSFGIYLWHFFFIGFFRTESGLHNFVFNYFISMCLSLFTYIVVEKNVGKLVNRKKG